MLKTELSTSGGTSDGRFIAPTGAQSVERFLNANIHQIDEHVNVADLEPLAEIYEQIFRRITLTISLQSHKRNSVEFLFITFKLKLKDLNSPNFT